MRCVKVFNAIDHSSQTRFECPNAMISCTAQSESDSFGFDTEFDHARPKIYKDLSSKASSFLFSIFSELGRVPEKTGTSTASHTIRLFLNTRVRADRGPMS